MALTKIMAPIFETGAIATLCAAGLPIDPTCNQLVISQSLVILMTEKGKNRMSVSRNFVQIYSSQ